MTRTRAVGHRATVPQNHSSNPGRCSAVVSGGHNRGEVALRAAPRAARANILDAHQTRIRGPERLDLGAARRATLGQASQTDGRRRWSALSGGIKRVALAQALVGPDAGVPRRASNHLDLDAILWLETCPRLPGRGRLITHDRAFLDATSTRIVELDRGFRSGQRFPAYERVKAKPAPEPLANALRQAAGAKEGSLDPQRRQARRTRSVSRVERLKVLRERSRARRDAVEPGASAGPSTAAAAKIVAELGRPARPSARAHHRCAISTTILRGDHIPA